IGSAAFRNLDPFLMLDFFDSKPAPGVGFFSHPHRGFVTCSYMLGGEGMLHEDHTGTKGHLRPGDLQWMTAGRGVLHSEIPIGDTNVRGLQLWVNLPASKKMIPPDYQEISASRVPTATSPDGQVVVRVLSGECMGVAAAVQTFSPITYLDVTIQPGASWTLPIDPSYTNFVFTLDGTARFGRDRVTGIAKASIVFNTDGTVLPVSVDADAAEPARFVFLSGKPLHEPIVQHGPFVMNTQREIYEAIQDFQSASNGFENSHDWTASIEAGRR
ncbi:hypothetical protein CAUPRSCDRAFT_9636, partial [Caulochytrium protostelioides]